MLSMVHLVSAISLKSENTNRADQVMFSHLHIDFGLLRLQPCWFLKKNHSLKEVSFIKLSVSINPGEIVSK